MAKRILAAFSSHVERNAMPDVIRAERKAAVLTPSSLACLRHTPTAGCAHECRDGYTRGYKAHSVERKSSYHRKRFCLWKSKK